MPINKYDDWEEIMAEEERRSSIASRQAQPPSESIHRSEQTLRTPRKRYEDLTELEEYQVDSSYEPAAEPVSEPPSDDGLGWNRKQQAFMRQMNLTVSAGIWARDKINIASLHNEKDPNFNLGVALESVTEEDKDFYLDCVTQKEFDYVRACLAEEKEDRRIIAETGFWDGLVHSGIALILDPASWTLVTRATKLVGLSKLGTTLLPKVARGAAGGTLIGGVSGTVKYATQNYKTPEEVIAETVFTAGLGAVLPVFGVGLSRILSLRKTFTKAATDPAHEFYWEPDGEGGWIETEVSSAPATVKIGEAQLDAPDRLAISKKSHKASKAAQGLLSGSMWGQAVMSPFKTINKLGDLLMRSNYVSNKVLVGADRFPSAESLLDQLEGSIVRFELDAVKSMKNYLGTKSARAIKAGRADFSELVRFDILYGPDNTVIEDPSIKAMSANWRKTCQQQLDEAFENGVTTKKWNLYEPMEKQFYDPETEQFVREWYFPRVYDLEKIENNQQAFKVLLFKANKGTTMRDVTDREIMRKVNEQIMSIKGLNPGSRYQAALGFEQERTILASSESLSDFTVNDPIKIIHIMHEQLAPKVALNKALRMRGIKDLNQLRGELEEEYLAGKEELDTQYLAGGEESEIVAAEQKEKSYDKAYKKAKKFINNMELIATGEMQYLTGETHPYISPIIRTLKDLTIAKSLGTTLITSVKDIELIVNNGEFRAAAGMVVQDIKGWTKRNPTIMKQYKQDLQEACVAMELNMIRTSQLLGASHRGFEDTLTSKMARFTVKYSGVPAWTDKMKTINGSLFTNGIFKRATKETIDEADKVWFSKYRIPSKFVPRIKEQFEKYGDVYEEYHIPNLTLWDDQEAKEIVCSAISTQSHTTVLLPSQYDTPLFLHRTFGSPYFMFYSYMFAYTNNVLAQWTTGTSQHKLATVIVDIGLTAAVKYLKAALSGDPYGGVDDKQLWMDTAKELENGGYPLAFATSLYDVGEGFVKGSTKEGVNRAIDKLAPIRTGLDLLDNARWAVGAIFGAHKRPVSEYRLRKIKSSFPNLFYINGIWNTMNRTYVRSHGGKLLKTRKERYLENKQ
jgi:hypothetical protein